MRVLQIYKDYWPVLGGIENHLRQLAEGLAQRGHAVTVLTVGQHRRGAEQIINGVRVIYAARLTTLSSAPLSPTLPLLVARERPDLVHLHLPDPTGDIAQTIARRAPLVITYHSDIVRQRRLLAGYAPLLRRTLRSASRIIATSPNYVQSSPFLQPLADRCSVIPYGIDLERFSSANPQRVAELRARFPGPTALFVGQLRYYKGVEVLLHALAQLPGVRAVLVGGEASVRRGELEALAYRLGILERVHLVGEQAADLPAYYHAADCFVLPSVERSEAFGIVQIEAQAAGLPIVATELSTGTSFVTRHGITGLIVPPRNPAALAHAINLLLTNPTLAQHLGTAGKQRAQSEFGVAMMIERYERVYQEIISRSVVHVRPDRSPAHEPAHRRNYRNRRRPRRD
jgi:glycosyltransferase involved in cell wall biosynthesis